MSGEKAAVKVPNGKLVGLLSILRGKFGSDGKREITRSVERKMEQFAIIARKTGDRLSRYLSVRELARCKNRKANQQGI